MRSFQDSQSSDTYPLSSTMKPSRIRIDGMVDSCGSPTKGQHHRANRGHEGRKERKVELSSINVGITEGVSKDSTPAVIVQSMPNDPPRYDLEHTDDSSKAKNSTPTDAVESMPNNLPRCDPEQQEREDLDDSSETLTPSISDITPMETGTLTLTEVSYDTLLQTTLDKTASHSDSQNIASLQLKYNQDLDMTSSSFEKTLVDPSSPPHYQSPTCLFSTGQSPVLLSPHHMQGTREKGNQTMLMSCDHQVDHLKKEECSELQTNIPQPTQPVPAPLLDSQDLTNYPTIAGGIVLSKENIATIVRNEMKASLQVLYIHL